MPDKKRGPSKKTPAKEKPSNRMKVLMLLLIGILVLSYVAIFIVPQSNYVTPPSPSSFEPHPWMSLIPAGVEGFRFLNMTQLSKYPNLFLDPVLLSIAEIGFNISVSEVTYGLDMQTKNNTVVSIIAEDKAESDRIAMALEGSNLTTAVYNNVTLYRLNIGPITNQGGAWICVYNQSVILSEGDILALEAIESVIDAPSNPFFSDDTFKVGYLTASLGEEQFAFSFFKSGDNTLKVDWEMRSATNSSGIMVRYLLYFPVSSDVDLKYQDVITSVLAKAGSVHKSDNVIFGDFSYSSSDIRAVLMGI
ncbi:MAG: hypothetical protein FJZ49_00860 [Candidatus Verstraetearchaeota archaeon]|nr:hypothetical protein [Candidatus Verstraetearchaeota archaeon]